jgi:hypothetical protein
MPRLGHGQQSLLPLLAERGVKTTVTPLYYLEHNPQLALLPADRMGRVLDPCTQLRQKPWSERAKGFRAQEFGNQPEPYDPDRARLDDRELLALALEPLDAQRSRGATLLLSTFHVAGAAGTRGRDIELTLAGIAIEQFRRERMDEPPVNGASDIPREIFATLAIGVEHLQSSRARSRLVEEYLSLDADGFWIKISGYHERAALEAIRAASAFLSALREGGRPVVSCGPGQLHLALLADEISASIGLGESERFTIPSTWTQTKKDGKPRGRMRMAYNPAMQWSFRIDSQKAGEAFASAPCDCAQHQRERPPGNAEVSRHAAVTRSEQASEALSGEREDRREWVLASSTMASWKAGDADMLRYHTATPRYEAVFEGLDAGGGLAAGEQGEL